MTVIETIEQQNATFASTRFNPGLKILPTLKTLVLGCVDPRVDPAVVLGLSHGDAAIIRNVGGRVTPDLIATLQMLGVVTRAGGGEVGAGWNLVVLHHSDCGITRLHTHPQLLSKFFGVAEGELASRAIDDARASVKVDVAALKATPQLPAKFLVTGLFYDVATGHIEVVVPTSPLRDDAP